MNIMAQNALTYRQTADRIGRSTGWISGAVNGKHIIEQAEFDEILLKLNVKKSTKNYASFVAAVVRKNKPKNIDFSGAILRHLREKKDLNLKAVSIATDYSISYLSELETGKKRVPETTRLKLLKLYGCSPGSYKNFCGNDKRADRVPAKYKLEILLNSADETTTKKILDFTKQLTAMNKN